MTHGEKHRRKHDYHHMETARTSNDTQPFPPCCYRACITWFLLRPSWRSSANRCACNRKSFRRRTHWALFTQTPSKHLRQDIWLWEDFPCCFSKAGLLPGLRHKHIKHTTYSTAYNTNSNKKTLLVIREWFQMFVGTLMLLFVSTSRVCSRVLCLPCCDPVHPVHGLRKWITLLTVSNSYNRPLNTMKLGERIMRKLNSS